MSPHMDFTNRVVGISLSTVSSRVGIAEALCLGDKVHVERYLSGLAWPRIVDLVAQMTSSKPPTLIAIAAPLGWPIAMVDGLWEHEAGKLLPGMAGLSYRLHEYDDNEDEPRSRHPDYSTLDEALTKRRNLFFRRRTEIGIRKNLPSDGSYPFGPPGLDVGSDKSARTGYMGLLLLDWIRTTANLEIPLAWSLGVVNQTSVIEVNARATCAGHGAVYGSREMRWLTVDIDAVVESDLFLGDQLPDAIVCVQAAADFLRGEAVPPQGKSAITRKEGWIWTKVQTDDQY